MPLITAPIAVIRRLTALIVGNTRLVARPWRLTNIVIAGRGLNFSVVHVFLRLQTPVSLFIGDRYVKDRFDRVASLARIYTILSVGKFVYFFFSFRVKKKKALCFEYFSIRRCTFKFSRNFTSPLTIDDSR